MENNETIAAAAAARTLAVLSKLTKNIDFQPTGDVLKNRASLNVLQALARRSDHSDAKGALTDTPPNTDYFAANDVLNESLAGALQEIAQNGVAAHVIAYIDNTDGAQILLTLYKHYVTTSEEVATSNAVSNFHQLHINSYFNAKFLWALLRQPRPTWRSSSARCTPPSSASNSSPPATPHR